MTEYRILVQSLKRLYNGGVNPKVSLAKLKDMVKEGTISDEEYKEITGEDYVAG